jgi:hypothetical protein
LGAAYLFQVSAGWKRLRQGLAGPDVLLWADPSWVEPSPRYAAFVSTGPPDNQFDIDGDPTW